MSRSGSARRTGSPAPRTRTTRALAAAGVVGLASGLIVAAGGGTAQAAPTIQAQSVGRFIDGLVGGMPTQNIADLEDARAQAAPDTQDYNPFTAKLAGMAEIPVGNALKLPGGGIADLGAANQVAAAKTDMASLGASGAVLNSGAAQLSDQNNPYPANAQLNLSGAALGSVPIPALPTGNGLPTTIPIPGLPVGATLPTNLAALGGVSANVGAVSAIASTNNGGTFNTPKSQIANLTLAIGSPALGGLLRQLKGLLDPATLNTVLDGTPAAGTPLTTLFTTFTTALSAAQGSFTGSDCALTATVPPTITLEDGGVVVDPANGTITVDFAALVRALLQVDISNLDVSNFDLISFLVENLPTILSQGLQNVVDGITTPLSDQFTKCTDALNAAVDSTPLGNVLGSPLAQALTALTTAIGTGQTSLESAIAQVTDPLVSASSTPLTQLASGLQQVVDIGLNVQSGPKIQPKETTYPFESNLNATPNQSTPVVAGQQLVRAVEIQLLNAATGAAGAGLPGVPPVPGIPGLPTGNSVNARQLAGAPAQVGARPLLKAPGDGAVALALANAAVGPGVPRQVPVTVPQGTAPVNTNIPTAIPAGVAGEQPGLPVLPLVSILALLAVGAASYLQWRGQRRITE